jgi:hypothetical protein
MLFDRLACLSANKSQAPILVYNSGCSRRRICTASFTQSQPGDLDISLYSQPIRVHDRILTNCRLGIQSLQVSDISSWVYEDVSCRVVASLEARPTLSPFLGVPQLKRLHISSVHPNQFPTAFLQIPRHIILIGQTWIV